MNGASMSLLHKKSKLVSALCAAATLAFLTPGPVQAADIHITVSNLRSSSGQIIVAAFDSPRTFGKAGRDVADVKIPVTAGTVQAVMSNIPDGVYALAAYHDENGNGKMDFNGIGIPLED